MRGKVVGLHVDLAKAAHRHLFGRQSRLGRRQGWDDDQRSDEDECAEGREGGGGREDARAMVACASDRSGVV